MYNQQPPGSLALWLSGSLALWLSGEVAYTWSLAVWERALPVEWLSSTFIHALHRQHQGTLSWQSITNPAGAFVKTMVGAGWFFPEKMGHRCFYDANGVQHDMLQISPGQVKLIARQNAALQLDREILLKLAPVTNWYGLIWWEALEGRFFHVKGFWNILCRNSLRAVVVGDCWTQARVSKHYSGSQDTCQWCHAARGTLFHRCFNCAGPGGSGALTSLRLSKTSARLRAAAARVALEPEYYQELFVRCLFPHPSWASGFDPTTLSPPDMKGKP